MHTTMMEANRRVVSETTGDRPRGAVAVAGRGRGGVGRRLGIVGGGQLARMTAVAAQRLGCEVVVLERGEDYPASSVATEALWGDWNRLEPLLELARRVEVVTVENEFVDAALLAALEERGHVVWPTARSLALVQDKYEQKRTLQAAGLPVPRMRAVGSLEELGAAAAELGWPLVLKARRNGYDGKGNATVRSAAELAPAWEQLGGAEGRELFVEAFCDFAAELAVIITRGADGATAVYPVVETVQQRHVCRLVRAPAAVEEGIARRAEEVARRAVESVGAVGSFGVEMFLTRGGEIVVNELAPRVHNSGHYTIEACACSQFENHVRAVLGLPLGSTRMMVPAAAMVNLLGERRGSGRPAGLERALAVAGAHLHLYGKADSAPGRKLGHVTAVGETVAEAERVAWACASEIRFGEET